MMFLANSLMDGYLLSSATGKGIVIAQLLSSVLMVAVIIGKWRELKFVRTVSKRFQRDFHSSEDVLEYYFKRRPTICSGFELIYKETCERLLKMLTPDTRSLLMGRGEASPSAALSKREIKLVESTCDHALDDEILRVGGSMTVIATVVALSPMLGLLGTVWGVLDAFADMGTAGSANLATIAPAIASALVTTVVGLLVAIPGTICFNALDSVIRDIVSDMEGFAEEVKGRIACEFQGRND